MVSSANDRSLYNNMTSNSIQIPIEQDLMSTTSDQSEECATSATSESYRVTLAPVIHTLESYFNDTSIIPVLEKIRRLLAASFDIVTNFFLRQ